VYETLVAKGERMA